MPSLPTEAQHSAVHSSPSSSSYSSLPSRRQWLILGVFGSVNLCLGITLSCIVPFFPGQAKAKGLSTAEIGFLIGFYQLGQAICAPMFGRSMARVGPNRLFSAGLCLAASAVICFGWLPRLPSASSFFWSALSLRALMAIGLSAYKCSQTTILAQQFPASLAAWCGLLDTFGALSYSLGPILGSALTHFGGYSLPFTAFGLLMFLSGLASIWLLSIGSAQSQSRIQSTSPQIFTSPADSAASTILAVPEIWLTALGLVSVQICTFFYDASLAEHIARLDPSSPMLTGTLISVTSIVSMVCGPLCGFLIDRNPRMLAEPTMLAGAVAGAVFALLIGPSPLVGFFPLSLPILFSAFAIQGVALVAMGTPSLKHCLQVAKERGFDTNSSSTCGCISGLIQGSISFGAFLGNTFGGVSTQVFGFEMTATFAAAIQLPFIISLVAFKGRGLLLTSFMQKDAQPFGSDHSSRQSSLSDDTAAGMTANYHPISSI